MSSWATRSESEALAKDLIAAASFNSLDEKQYQTPSLRFPGWWIFPEGNRHMEQKDIKEKWNGTKMQFIEQEIHI